MQDSFNKFKKKILLEVLIKSIAIGLSFGLLSFSAPLLYFKINKMEYNILHMILIGVGVSALVFAVLFLTLKPTKIRIAKRIDKQLNLNEKVQTMVEYEKEDSFMIKVQREDTLNILSNISIKKLTMKFSIIFFLLIFIACSVCVTSFAYPTEDNEDDIPAEEGEDDPDYNVDDWTIRAIKDLIKVVEESSIVDSLKIKYVAELNNLIVEIEKADKNSEMESLVFSIIDTVKLELDIVNTNNEIYEVLKSSDSKAISSFAVKLYNLEVEDADIAIESIISEINGVYNAIPEMNENFGVILSKSLLDKEDELCKTLFELANDLSICVDGRDVLTKDVYDSNVYSKVSETVSKHRKTINNLILQQKVNSDMAIYIEETLLNIFGLVEENTEDNQEDKNPNSTNPDDPENEEEQGGAGEGGLGTGEPLFGSDDTLFDPEEGEVKYGDVITGYYGTILGKLNDGILPEEYRENFEYYFKLLFGTLEENE